MKKLGAFLLSVVLCFGLLIIPSAALGVENELIQPQVVPQCGHYATHDMLSAGWGNIFNKGTGTSLFSGWRSCFQCTRCYLVLVCENEPLNGYPCGLWATWQPNERLTSTYTTILKNPNEIYYESSDRIYGVTFRYHQYN
ncbi:hypothetical protein Desde_2208 [Desulfitobacterium dehalogenans ATCC 51507]|uniref:Uncharacterized protein n=1 Tax=Desulfitobacterium dehalogenans (strain ATCC 51507 / DSM 9161 / JW/IU-DC1) TaxID=756499 RepID=I4A9B9_DESDJ|nr:hypothetical protein [Desulfitobacterium dehalogenans]AFM00554.1 hypothetical protein Desde_2208 [Desulfitobacterium dehalogenans ATCC 51507]